MTPATEIAKLDRQIASHGQAVTLRRIAANKPAVEAGLQAFVRGYRANELVAGIQQGDTLVTLSPSGLSGTIFETEIPKSGDRIVIEGRVRNVQLVDPVRLGDTLVRLNLQVRG